MDRAKWYQWHSWLGLKFAILTCFILITGTFAVLSHEIDWLTNSAMRVDSDTARPVQWAPVYSSAHSQFPDADLVSLSVNDEPWFAAEAVYVDREGERFRAFFHPATGEYQGVGRWFNWQRFFRMTHRHLMLPLSVGVTVVCTIGLLLFGSLLTGTVIYKGWWKGFCRWPRTTNPKVFWGDLHRLCGVWSGWLLVVLCVTGTWYLAEQWGARASYPDTGTSQHEYSGMPDEQQFTHLLATAQEVRPDIRISNIRFPNQRLNVVLIEGQGDEVLVRDRANNIVLNPYDGEVISVRHADKLSLHVRISEAADPLHFGYFGGFITKVIYFVFGLILSLLALTGTWIYALRVTRRKHPHKVKNIGRGMNWAGWGSLLFITICLIDTLYVFS